MFLGSFIGNVCGAAFFVLFQIAGIILISLYFEKTESAPAKLILGSVFGSLLLQWFPILTAFVFGFNIAGHLFAAVCLIALVIGICCKRKASLSNAFSRERFYIFLRSILKNTGIVITFILMMVLWGVLLYREIIPLRADGSIHTGQCNYGDMNMHLGFLTSIAKQSFPPDYSIFPGTKLAYPFLCDSISSSVYIFGASLRFSYILPMVFAFAQLIGTVYILAKNYLKTAKRALAAVLLFFFNGGLGFIYFINWSEDPKYTFKDIFTGFYTTPTNLNAENIRWSNLINDMFLPQRATLFGYAVLFPAIYLLYRAIREKQPKYFWAAALFGGGLPLIHTHSFLAYGLISAGFMFVELYNVVSKNSIRLGRALSWGILITMLILSHAIRQDNINEDFLMKFSIVVFAGFGVCFFATLFRYLNKENFPTMVKTWGAFLIIVMVLALPQLLGFTFGQVSEGGFVRGHFNWANLGDNYIWFYIKNWGIMAILSFIALCNIRNKDLTFAFPVFLIWFLAETIVFTPNTYDNNKIIYVGFLLLVIVSVDYAAKIYNRIKSMPSLKILAWITLGFCMVSALLSIAREVYSDYEVYGADQVQMAMWIEQNTDEKDIILTSDQHNNAVPCLTGRRIVCGSSFFLYFHGIDNSYRLAEVRVMYESPSEAMSLYEKYSVDYVCVSSYERSNYAINDYEFEELFEPVFRHGDVTLYKVNR